MKTKGLVGLNLAAAQALAGRLMGLAVGLAACAVVTSAQAQDESMTPIAVPAQPDAIELGTGSLANATVPESWPSRRIRR